MTHGSKGPEDRPGRTKTRKVPRAAQKPVHATRAAIRQAVREVRTGNEKATDIAAGVVLGETVQGWEVWIGNGDRYQCHHHTLVESTARRLARCRGYYTPVTMHVINGRLHAPISGVADPTWDDHEEERKMAHRQRVLERVRDLGLSQEELDLLGWKP